MISDDVLLVYSWFTVLFYPAVNSIVFALLIWGMVRLKGVQSIGLMLLLASVAVSLLLQLDVAFLKIIVSLFQETIPFEILLINITLEILSGILFIAAVYMLACREKGGG